MNDVILNKKTSIERCAGQARAYYETDTGVPFERDHFRQDAIAMNLQRAAERTIGIANHLVKSRKLGLPADSRESFALLEQAGLIDSALAKKLQAMVGFRNILVHEYRRIDTGVMRDVIENRLQDLLDFANTAVKLAD